MTESNTSAPAEAPEYRKRGRSKTPLIITIAVIAVAAIVAAGSPAPDVTELREFLLGHGVAKFKAPEQVVCIDALPKNDAGKVLKHALKTGLSKES